MSSSYSRCAACKCLRRKCPHDYCIFAPHFPPSKPQRFAMVHKVFGAANITKMLEQVPVHLRGQAAECMVFEAAMRTNDPVYGSVGVISQLQQQIMQAQKEMVKIHGEIALQHARTMQQVGLGHDVFNGLSSGEEVGTASNGQTYEIDLDEMYSNFCG